MECTIKNIYLVKKRGRPKSNRPSIDTGTPETVMKRLFGMTSEALDLLLEHNIINKKQHWCGMHLRWLYTIRYGAPGGSALDLLNEHDHKIFNMEKHDALWLKAREDEYNEAMQLLKHAGYSNVIINLCVFNETPYHINTLIYKKQINSILQKDTTRKFIDGLNILVKFWYS